MNLQFGNWGVGGSFAAQTYSLGEYLYAYVHANDVGGSGDQVCALTGVSGGFKLRAKMSDGTTFSGPQMTQDYFGTGTQWKQVAIPVPGAYEASDVVGMTFDAYDNDGIYFLSIGEAFFVRPKGDDGATLDWVHMGQTDFDVYVDDDSSGCTNGVSTGGPGGTPYPCVGGSYDFTP